ncbi:MAG: LLM class flavin-dependent oxidoreductase [Candidatus Thorarchaeota archaeon]|jgi:alkanesulfonate monooxygenase SsuD/methylene tetrahydromethanopterin reductase-like flavin-dependent oxidoreductase (luciferase family)
MKFFLGGLGNWYNNYELVEKGILEADRLDFDAALMPDHYMWGEMGGMMHRPDSNVTMESWITLTYLAAKTKQIQLGTMVTPIPFRPPGMLAKMISTLDVLSNGRVIAGVGAGWSQVEFEGYSEWNKSRTRVDKTHEGLVLMLELWTKDKVDFEGKFYKAKGAVLEPKPVQKPYPKLLFGSRGSRMLGLSGTYGDIIYIPPWQMGGGPVDIEAARKKVLQAAEEAKRADKIGFMAGSMMGQQITEPDEFIKAIESAKESGHRYYLVSLPREGDIAEFLGKFAKEVMPSFR